MELKDKKHAVNKITELMKNTTHLIGIKTTQISQGAVHQAVRSGDVEALKYYISCGANVNEQTHTWNTPLHELQHTRKNFVALTEILLDRGCLPDTLNKNDDNFAHQISVNKYVTPEEYHEWVSFVLSRGLGYLWHHKGWRGRTPLHSALATMDLEKCTLEIILNGTGLGIEEKNDFGNTPLLLAVGFGRKLNTLKYLVEVGADVNVTDKQKNGVLHKAICNSDVEGVEYFISVGAQVDERNSCGSTPLHKLASANKNHLKLTQLLLEAGADIDEPNGKGKTISELLKFQLSKNKYLTWKEFVDKYRNSSTAHRNTSHKALGFTSESTRAKMILAHLNANLVKLVQNTVVNVTLECYLQENGILCQEDLENLHSKPTSSSRNQAFYELLGKRIVDDTKPYDVFVAALQETKQSGVLEILQRLDYHI